MANSSTIDARLRATRPTNPALYWGIAAAVIVVLALFFAFRDRTVGPDATTNNPAVMDTGAPGIRVIPANETPTPTNP